jgi:hypothetical protein
MKLAIKDRNRCCGHRFAITKEKAGLSREKEPAHPWRPAGFSVN